MLCIYQILNIQKKLDPMSKKENTLNTYLFKRLLNYVRPYNYIFIFSLMAVFGLAVFGALRPVVLEKILDENISLRLSDGFLQLIIADTCFEVQVVEAQQCFSCLPSP